MYRELAAPLRLSAAPRPHRSRHGQQGHRRVDRRDGRAAAGRHRRHHPRLAHARAQRRPHARGDRRAGDPADDGPALVHAAGHGVPGLRPHDEHLLPGARRAHPVLSARVDAGVAREVRRRRGHARRGDGLRGQRPRRVEAREHRHLAAGHRRDAGGTRVRRRREDRDAQGRPHRGRIRGARGGLRALDVRRRGRCRPRSSRRRKRSPSRPSRKAVHTWLRHCRPCAA